MSSQDTDQPIDNKDSLHATDESPPVVAAPKLWSRKQLKYLILLIVGALAIILVGVLVQKPTDPLDYARTLGYGGVFIMAVIGSSAPIWPLPGSWAAGLAAAFGLNPFFLGLIAGIGEPIGELSGYTAGYGGKIATAKWKRYAQLERLMKRYGGTTIFVVSAIPNFFIKLVTFAAGNLHYPLWKFFIFCWAGKTIKSWGFAFVGLWASDWLIDKFVGTL